MREVLSFSLHYSNVVFDKETGEPLGMMDGTKTVKTANPREAYAMAKDLAEATGCPVIIINRALNIDRKFLPKYLQRRVHPE